MNSNRRPVYLNLLEFSFPATAVASLLHRISGAVLFLALPLLIYGLEYSLQGEQGMAALQQLWQLQSVRTIAVVVAWALLHHWLAGWRFLLADVEIGVDIRKARSTARLLNIASLAGLLVIGGMLL